MIRVSVIVPVYNVEKYILRCIKSVAEQTATDGIECIIVDDCGKDSSVALCEDFVKSYSGNVLFSIFHNECNKGLSGARNSGIRIAKGEYLYFLDGDDEIKRDCLANFLQIVGKHPNVDLVQGLYENESDYMRSFLSKKIPTYTENRKQIKRMLLDYDALPVTAHNKLVKTDLIRKNNIYFKEGIVHEDNHWSYFLAKHVRSFAFCPRQCYIYYTTPGSIMTDPKRDKELYSYQTILKDFCNSIDPFMKGAQKRGAFLILTAILGNKYYNSEKEKQSLVECVVAKHNPIERLLLTLYTRKSATSRVQSLVVKILLKLYKIEDCL